MPREGSSSRKAAQHIWHLAKDITKQDPRKPRLVAGLIGPNSNLLLGAPDPPAPSLLMSCSKRS